MFDLFICQDYTVNFIGLNLPYFSQNGWGDAENVRIGVI